jgi:S1-C subfamily serine protease
VGEGRKYIDDYRIVDVLHEGHVSFLCRAIRQRTAEMVMIRLFTPESGVDEAAAAKLRRELEALKKLPEEGFVKHYAIRQAPDGLWYRISEWLETESWGSLLASERLSDRRVLFDLFYQMASALSLLHKEGYFIPHLILNDIIPINGDGKGLQVKIDYKLSRFFDPKLDRPGPMLKRLLRCHPDIINQRPLDFRSDIWSLGKVFVEILTADLESTDFVSKIEELNLPREAEVLLKVMLADDPDIRPRSMAEVADSLARIRAREMANGKVQGPQVTIASKKEEPEIPIIAGPPKRGFAKWLGLSAALLFLMAIAGYLAFFQPGERMEDAASALEDYANKYAPSVAFLLVEYWLEVDGEKSYDNVAEGTAFLVDADGYMLTSRHVVCPWMDDMGLYATAQQYQINNMSPRFGYRLFLWFEGAKAFNRVAAVMEAPDLSDVYFVEDAFSTESTPGVSIAGVPKTPIQRREVDTSPVQDDYAVLKIDRVPPGLVPLPLDTAMDAESVPKLSRFITLGFPLGSRTQEATVNVSVTTGHVRRAFENMLQVDGSIHKGNSGGPIIDTRGKVIGIVSGVALDYAQGLVPMVMPRWDMGMVLPITRVVEFLGEIRAGQVKWNGVLDFSVEETVRKISEAAVQGRWAEAQVLADKELESNMQPSLIMAAGVMHFCTRDLQGARHLFSESLSMDAENYDAKLMLSIIDWLVNGKAASTHRRDLLASDWRSPAEFHGYLVRVLDGVTSEASALKAWYTEAEKSWLYYVVGLVRAKRQDWRGSEKVLQEAVLAADLDAWEFVLARSKLEEVQKRRRESLKTEAEWTDYNANLELFNQAVKKAQEEKKNREKELGPLRAKLMEETSSMEDKLQVLKEIQKLFPNNRNIALALAFYSAADESWPQALEYIGAVLKEEGRQNSDRMSLGLLKAGILHYQGHEDEARASLEAFVRQTRDPWYLAISEYLLGKQTLEALTKGAGKSPENLISAYTPLGFWAEGSGDKKRAIKNYKLALESYLDSWIEYDFAKERLKKLKKPSQ